MPRGWQRVARSEGVKERTSLPKDSNQSISPELTSEPLAYEVGPQFAEPAQRIASRSAEEASGEPLVVASLPPAPQASVEVAVAPVPSPEAAVPERLAEPEIAKPSAPEEVASLPETGQPAVPPMELPKEPTVAEVAPTPVVSKPGQAETTDEGAVKTNPELVARRLPTPVPGASFPRSELQTKPEMAYPDTGLPAARAGVSKAADRAPETASPIEPGWCDPETLLRTLDELVSHDATRTWASEAARLIRRLGPAVLGNFPETSEILQRLDQLAAQAPAMVSKSKDRTVAKDLSRAGHAIERRVAVWKQIVQVQRSSSVQPIEPSVNQEAMALCLAKIDDLTEDSREGPAWREYLLLDALRESAARRNPQGEGIPRELAQQVLRRLHQASLTARQREFLSTGPVADLEEELLRQTAEPVDLGRLLRHIELYEKTDLSGDATLLARDCRLLALAPDAAHRQLGRRVESYYRNANLRIAISEALLNRLIPKRDDEFAPVRDTVHGLPVRGQSLTSTDVAVRLLPDPEHVRLALEVTGEVASLTSSTSGPATFVNAGDAMYIVRKPLQVDLQGIRLGRTEVEVYNNMQLRNLRTDFDHFPLLGSIVRSVARSEHDKQRPAVSAEVRQKIAAKAQERTDAETRERLTQAARTLQQKVLGPMNALALAPTLISAETTEERFTMRLRLAGKDQLGSHTPRPQAPANALASFQVHESVLNNVIQRLELDGRTFELPELSKHIAQRLNQPEPKESNPDREDATITFAAHDAVRVRCTEGRIELTVSIAKLAKQPRAWKDFQVRAIYRPEIEGRQVHLVRDGVVQLIGPRLTAGGQIAIRGVFSRTFSKKMPWDLMPERLATDPKLADLTVTQFAVEDGWLGVSLGPQRTALRAAAKR
jgi:hypothetical protein